MGSQNLILYQFNSLCHILKELEQDLNFKVVEISNKKNLNDYIENHKNYLIITKQNSLNINNQIIFDNLPIKINKLIEIVHVEFLKLQFNDQSQININNYYNYYGYSYGPWYNFNYNTSTTQGTLYVDIVDYKKNELVWQGIGKGYISEKTSKKEEQIKSFVNKILLQYPVK